MIDNSNIKIISHVWIRDPDSNLTILNQRDSAPRVHTVQKEIAPDAEHNNTGSDDNEDDY